MKNPFKFDIEVDGRFFCGRTEDIKEVMSYIENETNIIMFSKRRIGKSSLVKEIFNNRLPEEILTAHIDIYAISNIRELYEHLKEGIESSLVRKINSLEKLAKLGEELRNYFSNVDIKLVVSGSPKLEFSSTEKDYYKALEQLFYGYFNYLKTKNLQAVIAIDEFQKIITLSKSEKVEALLRTIVNKRNNCSFIFTGSKRNLLLSLFNRSDRPFFKLGVEYPLGAIDFMEFFRWTQKRFQMKNILLEEDAFRYLYDEVDGETRFVQLISYELFKRQDSESVITLPVVQRYIKEAISKKKDIGTLLETYTIAQQNTLKIIAVSDGDNVFEEELARKYDIKRSSIQSAIESLKTKGIVFNTDGILQFEDVEFKLWLKSI
ncbi:MAG: hypothetical protein DRG24_10060 [Epsilonproteobacteria bacterium]|nr:MAG: hypothetical protein DRG24_10060 [Campylobacterota bacterium]